MSVERFFLDGFGSEEAYETLKASDCFPLVREMQFRYGLKVIKADASTYVMGYNNGLTVCRIYMGSNDNGDKVFACRAPWSKKLRGSSQADKETVTSVKVSSLMATLKRMEAIPDEKSLVNKYCNRLCNAVNELRRGLGDSNKNNSVNVSGDEFHAILLMALGKSPNSEWVHIDQNKCQILLDKLEEKDRIKKQMIVESDRFFTNPFYMIGVDTHNHYVVGKFKMTTVSTKSNEMQYETIEPFKRYASYEQVPEIVPVMTMLKIAYEDKTNYSKQGVVPIADLYDSSLDAVFVYNSRPDPFNHEYAWMVTPC